MKLRLTVAPVPVPFPLTHRGPGWNAEQVDPHLPLFHMSLPKKARKGIDIGAPAKRQIVVNPAG